MHAMDTFKTNWSDEKNTKIELRFSLLEANCDQIGSKIKSLPTFQRNPLAYILESS